MNNLSRYNDFINSKKIFEEKSTPPNDIGGYGKDGTDTFFANVKGNLAGAENTLVGAAVLKFVGFLKRKGVQIYLSTVLIPQLGKVYMNGILRYSLKNDIKNFPIKDTFAIKKVSEDGELVDVEDKVGFKTTTGVVGLPGFTVGSTVSTITGNSLGNGMFQLLINGMYFNIGDNIITYIGEEPNITEVQSKPIEHEVESQPTEKTYDIVVSDDIIDDIKSDIENINKMFTDVKNETTDKLSEENKEKLTKWIDTLSISIRDIEKLGLDDIKKELEKTPDMIKKLELEKDLKLYNDSFTYLTNIKKILSDYLKDKSVVLTTPIDTVKESSIFKNITDFLNEASAPVVVTDKVLKPNVAKVNRYGDELQKYVGQAIDLNNESFYSQFENIEVKKAVSNEILTDIASLNRIQLAADRLISENKKLDFDWKKMVNRVLSLYSKFMVTDMVNPYKIIANTPDASTKYGVGTGGSSNPVNKLNNVLLLSKATKNKLFETSVTDIKTPSDLNNGDYSILDLSFKGGKYDIKEQNYLLKTVTSDKKSDFKIFKIIGKINLNDVESHKEPDFKSLVVKDYGELTPSKTDAAGRKLKSVYVVNNKKTNFVVGKNEVSIVYLYTKEDKWVNIKWDDTSSYNFVIKNVSTGSELDIIKLGTVKGFENNYKISMTIDNELKIKIKEHKLFSDVGDNMTDVFTAHPDVLSMFDTFKSGLLK